MSDTEKLTGRISEQELKLGQFAEAGSNLTNTLKENQKTIPPRRFKGQDLANSLGVVKSSITNAEAAGRITFDRDTQGRRLGATHQQMMEMQEVFGTSPRCRDGEKGVVLSIQSLKGGSWKSSNCQYMGTYYASLGLRVCLIDCDPQASLSVNMGKEPDVDIHAKDTLYEFILDMEPEGKKISSIVQDTHIPNMKIIPSCLAMAHCDFNLTTALMEADKANDQDAKENILTRVHQNVELLKDDFDVILIDGLPSISLLAMNIVLACDACVIPTATEAVDLAATISFCTMLEEQLRIIRNGIGKVDLFPEFKILPTRFAAGNSPAASAEMLDQMREIFGDACLDNYIKKHDAVVSNLSLLRRTVFDTNGGKIETSIGEMNISSKARKSAIENFSAAYDEILEKLILPCWPERINAQKILRGK